MSVRHGSKEALNKRNKKKYELGSYSTKTKVSEEDQRKEVSRKGGVLKTRLKKASKANLLDPKKNSYTIAKITGVKNNPANRNYARESVVTKGAIIETDKGDAKVTSRPGQDGVVNAVLVK